MRRIIKIFIPVLVIVSMGIGIGMNCKADDSIRLSYGKLKSNGFLFEASDFDKIYAVEEEAANKAYELGKSKGTTSGLNTPGVSTHYTYHQHINASGSVVSGTTYPTAGGCFNNPVYHTHSRDKGCYRIVSCESTSWHTESTTESNGDVRTRWVCSGCGKVGGLTGYQLNNANGYSWNVSSPMPGRCGQELSCTLICTKGNSIDYYTCTCGLSAGQVETANVTFTPPVNTPSPDSTDVYSLGVAKSPVAFKSTGVIISKDVKFDSLDFNNLAIKIKCEKDSAFNRGLVDGFVSALAEPLKSQAKVQSHFHTHVDANGNVVDNEYCQTKGGCFTIPVYHKHDSSCYTVREDGQVIVTCGKTETDIDYYASSCGYVNGGIESIDVNYNKLFVP